MSAGLDNAPGRSFITQISRTQEALCNENVLTTTVYLDHGVLEEKVRGKMSRHLYFNDKETKNNRQLPWVPQL